MTAQGFQRTAPPNPGWKYGQTLNDTPQGREWMVGLEEHGWKTYIPENENAQYVKLYTHR
jgi:hypothetical protein